jgi:hypothetical protein
MVQMDHVLSPGANPRGVVMAVEMSTSNPLSTSLPTAAN